MTKGLKITSKQLVKLCPILEEWMALNERIGRDWSAVGDAPWWHIERALLSLFAGAIWRIGGDAFEEYTEVKRKNTRRTTGRIDLWFSFENQDYKAEAKQCWVRPLHPKSAIATVNDAMTRAKEDAGALTADGMRRLAMVFGAVLIPKSRKAELRSLIATSVQIATDNAIHADAVAWTFPDLPKTPLSPDGYLSPGIILWIQEVPRAKSKSKG